MSSQIGGRILTFGLLYAVILVAARIQVISVNAGGVASDYLIGILLGGLTEFLYGLVIGYLAWKLRPRAWWRFALGAVVAASLLVKLASYHYEAVFGRLPNADLWFYLDQLPYLSSSLRANLPPLTLAVEWTVVAALLSCAYYRMLVRKGAAAINGHWPIWAAASAVGAAIMVSAFPAVVPEPLFWGSREPLIWLAQSRFVRERYHLEELRLRAEDFDRFLILHGKRGPGPAVHPDYPLCRAVAAQRTRPNLRSVVILILESVGYAEMMGSFQGVPLMPNLQHIAANNLSFSRAKAPGIKSIQTLTAVYSGLPANPFGNYLWQTPFPAFDGLPNLLRDRGYRTAYFHGADLSFERQRQYLQAVGFDQIFDFGSFGDAPAYGWGYDDGFMFRQFQNWLNERDATGQPYLATLFTLSSHDPYVLPPGWMPVFSTATRVLKSLKNCCDIEGEKRNSVALAETYRFLDAQLEDFYQWYRGLKERPILVILGDHAPHLANDDAVVQSRELRFDVPLIIAGLGPAVLAEQRRHQDRPAVLHDIPATVLPLLGLPEHECTIGLNLFASDPEWPADRFTYAAGPESLEKIHVWYRGGEFVLNRVTGGYRLLNRTMGATEAPAADDIAAVRNFLQSTLPVHYFLLEQNAYFIPPRTNRAPAEPLPRVGEPVFAAHRANFEGAAGPRVENRRGALERLRDSRFKWVELDVQLTKDGVPVLMHDATIAVGNEAIPIAHLTLGELRDQKGYEDVLTLDETLDAYSSRFNFLVEVKPQKRVDQMLLISRVVGRAVRAHSRRSKIIVDSFDENIASSIKIYCGCEIGLDNEYQKRLTEPDLQHLHSLGFDWIYVHHTVTDAALVRAAHRQGLKVMAYTVNEMEIIEEWRRQGELPDGIITDHETLVPSG